jgi:hypothetical protein
MRIQTETLIDLIKNECEKIGRRPEQEFLFWAKCIACGGNIYIGLYDMVSYADNGYLTFAEPRMTHDPRQHEICGCERELGLNDNSILQAMMQLEHKYGRKALEEMAHIHGQGGLN